MTFTERAEILVPSSSIERTAALMAMAVSTEKAVRLRIIRMAMRCAPTNVLVARYIGVVAFGQVIVIEASAISIIARVYFRTYPRPNPPRPRIPPAAMLIDVGSVTIEGGLGLSGRSLTVKPADGYQVRCRLHVEKYRAHTCRGGHRGHGHQTAGANEKRRNYRVLQQGTALLHRMSPSPAS